MWSEVRARRAQVLAALMYVFLVFGGLWVFSALGRDSLYWWDTVERSTNAIVGVVILGLALPFGVAALVLYRRDGRTSVPGERSSGLQHPGWIVIGLVVTVAIMLFVILWLIFGYVPETNRRGI
jgi:uncharacterized BrkB/YihY/UPF0761 family membrane protein